MRAFVSSVIGLLLLLFVGIVTAQNPTLIISPDVVTIGSPFNVIANGLKPNTTYVLAIVNPSDQSSVFETDSTSNASGRIALNLTTSTTTDQPGTYRIELREGTTVVIGQDFKLQAGDQPAAASTLIAPPLSTPSASSDANVTVFPTEGVVGTAFEIFVSQMPAGQALQLSIQGPDGTEVYAADRTTKDDGTVDVKIFTEKTDTAGTYTITVKSGDTVAQTSFALTAAGNEVGTVTITAHTQDTTPSYNIAVENVKPFADLKVIVKDPNSKDSLFEGRVRAGVDGKALVVFTPEPGTTAGTYDVLVLDRDVQVANSTVTLDEATLALLGGAVLRITPATGEAGALRLITVSGLTAGETVTVEIARGTTVVSTQDKTADVNGTIAFGLRSIGDDALGEYAVRVLRGETAVAKGTLTIAAAAVVQPTSNATLTISPTSGAGGTSFDVTIQGLTPNAPVTVNVVFDGKTVYATDKTADANGTVTMTLETTSTDLVGMYTVSVISAGTTLASGDLTVTADEATPGATLESANPSPVTVTIDPASGPQGTQHLIHIVGLSANAEVTIDLTLDGRVVFSSQKTASVDGVIDYAIQTEESDTPGIYTVDVRKADISLGSATLTIEGASAQPSSTETPEATTEATAEATTRPTAIPTPAATVEPTAESTVEPSAQITLSIDPAAGPHGTTHVVTVTGLQPNETVEFEVLFGGTSILTGTLVADTTGTAVNQLTSEESDLSGEYVVEIRQNQTLVASGSFTVQNGTATPLATQDATAEPTQEATQEANPSDIVVSVDPQSAALGTSAAVAVTGLPANTEIGFQVLFDDNVVYTTTKTTDADGQATLVLETSSSDLVGEYTINVLVDDEIVGSGTLEVTMSDGNTGPEGNPTATPGPEDQGHSVESTPLLDVTDTLGDTPMEYTFDGKKGDTIIATLSSSAFDAYLELRAADGTTLASNDDFNGTDAQIGPFPLSDDGTYTLVVSSYSSDGSTMMGGDFSLQVKSVTPQEIQPDTPKTLTFSADAQAYYFTFAGEVGDVINITATSTDHVDTLLTLLDSTGTVIAIDDDGGVGYDPEIYQFSLSSAGTYTIVLTTTETSGSADLLLMQEKAASLDEGAQAVQITPKLTSRALTYEAQAGETILLHVSVTSGDPVDLTITAYQNDALLMSYTTSNIPDGTVLGFEVPASGQVQIFVSGSNPGAVSVEMSVGK